MDGKKGGYLHDWMDVGIDSLPSSYYEAGYKQHIKII